MRGPFFFRLTPRRPSGMLFCMQKKLTAEQVQTHHQNAHLICPCDACVYTGKKATRRAARTEAAIAAGRKTFSQLREEVAARDPDRYAFRNPGTRKTGMIAVNAIFIRKK